MRSFIITLFTLILLVGCGTRNTKKVAEESPYGDWEICEYTDDFDEPTGEKYVRQIIYGHFSNSATASSPLRVIVFLHHNFNSYSKQHSVEGYMRFDEYCDGTEDFHIWNDGSPAKDGTKIIDKPNHKAYYMEDHSLFFDREENKSYYWPDILRKSVSTYDFTIKGEYKDEYRFSINTDKLEFALKEAGILKDIVNE